MKHTFISYNCERICKDEIILISWERWGFTGNMGVSCFYMPIIYSQTIIVVFIELYLYDITCWDPGRQENAVWSGWLVAVCRYSATECTSLGAIVSDLNQVPKFSIPNKVVFSVIIHKKKEERKLRDITLSPGSFNDPFDSVLRNITFIIKHSLWGNIQPESASAPTYPLIVTLVLLYIFKLDVLVDTSFSNVRHPS